jgi:putative oxidoreductase
MKRIFDPAPLPAAYNVVSLLMRLVAGSFMLTHGLPKLEKFISGDTGFADPFGLGSTATLALTIFAEVGCSVLILLGLGTRLAVLPLAFAMFTAAFVIHQDDPFGKKELALMYLLIYTAVFLLGSGKYSLDHLIHGQTQKKKPR